MVSHHLKRTRHVYRGGLPDAVFYLWPGFSGLHAIEKGKFPDSQVPQQYGCWACALDYLKFNTSILGSYSQHLCYGVWFTGGGNRGMFAMMPSPESRVGGCSVYAFFFVKVNLFRWFRQVLHAFLFLSMLVETWRSKEEMITWHPHKGLAGTGKIWLGWCSCRRGSCRSPVLACKNCVLR